MVRFCIAVAFAIVFIPGYHDYAQAWPPFYEYTLMTEGERALGHQTLILGQQHLHQKEYGACATELEKSVKHWSSKRAYIDLSICYMVLGYYERMEKAVIEGLAVGYPRDELDEVLRAREEDQMLLDQLSLRYEAEEEFDEGTAHWLKDEYAECVTSFKNSVAIRPSKEAYVRLSMCYIVSFR